MKFWHAFIVPPMKERAAEAILRRQGHECLVPAERRVRRLRFGHRRRSEISLPIYPRHVFVAASDEIWGPGGVCDCRLVIGVRGIGGKPWEIPDAEMQRFIGNLAKAPSLEPQFQLKAGSGVRVKRGTFAHLSGTVESIENNRALVSFALFKRACETLVNLEDLEVLQINSDTAGKQWTTRSKSFRRESVLS